MILYFMKNKHFYLLKFNSLLQQNWNMTDSSIFIYAKLYKKYNTYMVWINFYRKIYLLSEVCHANNTVVISKWTDRNNYKLVLFEHFYILFFSLVTSLSSTFLLCKSTLLKLISALLKFNKLCCSPNSRNCAVKFYMKTTKHILL